MDNAVNVECSQSGIFCDNPDCDYENMAVSSSDYLEWVNKPCPKCGENLLTEEDYSQSIFIKSAMSFINRLSVDELNEITKNVDIEELKKNPVFSGAKGLDLLDDKGEFKNISMVIESHKGIRITELYKED